MECFIILDTKHFFFLSPLLTSLRREEQKLIQRHIIAGSDEESGRGGGGRCRIVFGDLLWFWRCWQTSKLLGSGPWDDMLSHPGYSTRSSFLEEAQLCDLASSRNALCHDLLISCDHAVFLRRRWGGGGGGGLIHKTHCSYFLRVSKLRCRPHVCFRPQHLPFSSESQVQKLHCTVKPFELHYVKLGIWFQMIAPVHAYALYKHEKAR